MSVYFLGKDAYTLYIQATCESLTDTVEIVDLFYYDSLTIDNNQYSTVSGSPVLTYGNNGLNVNTSVSQIGLVKNNFLTLPSNYEAEITITSQTASSGCGICFDDWLLDSGAVSICSTYKLSTTTRLSTNLSKFNTGDTVKIVKQGTSISYYLNGVLKVTNTISNDTHLQQFRTYQNRSTTFKDLKIHEL